MKLLISTRRAEGGAAFRQSRRPQKSRVYFFPENETVLENLLQGRHNRPFREYRKLLPFVLRHLGQDTPKASWSSKAGCSMCPCSPGFILDTTALGIDIFVTVIDDGETCISTQLKS